MRTCGLDLATTTGMALVGDDEDRGKSVAITMVHGFQRLQLIAKDIERTIDIWLPDLVIIERYAYCKNVASFIRLVEVGTLVRAALSARSHNWIEVPPTVLKKWTTGRGNASKDEMRLAVKERWGFTSESHDVVDAYALAQMGQLGRATLLEMNGIISGG